MTSRVTYLGDLRTECEHLQSGNKIITDAPVDNQGKGETFSPTDTVATALASCMLTVMGIKARDMKVDIEGTTAAVTKVMAADPRRISEIEVVLAFPPPMTRRPRQSLKGQRRPALCFTAFIRILRSRSFLITGSSHSASELQCERFGGCG